jgi:hypothetical protein
MNKNPQFNSKKIWNSGKKSTSYQSRSKVFESSESKINLENNSNTNKVFEPIKTKAAVSSFWSELSHRFYDWKKTKYDFVWFREINSWFVNFHIIRKINRNILPVICAFLLIFVSYLSFIDTHFVIKSYDIRFSENSYLSQSQTSFLIDSLQKNKVLGFLPNNQYWFLNSQTLTASAKEIIPDIQEVNLENRTWPNKAMLTINTKPILVTLSVKENNEQKYWRISPEGNVVSADNAGIWENLVLVEKPYAISFQDKQNDDLASLKNFSFKNNKVQINKFNLIQKLWPVLMENGIKVVTTSVPSLVDSDIFFLTENGTKLMFDSQVFDNENQIRRVNEFLKKIDNNGNKILDLEQNGKLKYIDFRIAKRLYFCYSGDKC